MEPEKGPFSSMLWHKQTANKTELKTLSLNIPNFTHFSQQNENICYQNDIYFNCMAFFGQ